jgi:cell division cycle 14
VSELDKLLKTPKFVSNMIYHFTDEDFAKTANAAYLMGAFQIIILGKSAE